MRLVGQGNVYEEVERNEVLENKRKISGKNRESGKLSM